VMEVWLMKSYQSKLWTDSHVLLQQIL